MRALILFTLATALAAAPAFGRTGACAPVTGGSVSVHGRAVIPVHPDTVTFSVGVQASSPSVTDAITAATSHIDRVTAALKHKGVTAEQIRTSSFEVNTITKRQGETRAFMVQTLVTVTVHRTDRIGDLLQSAFDAGANQAGGLRFSVADPGVVRQRGLQAAYDNAHSKALTLATLAGRSLGAVACISDETALHPFAGPAGFPLPRASGLQVEPGMESQTFDVSVVFELK